MTLTTNSILHFAAALAIVSPAIAGAPAYDITELPALPGHPYGRILDINNHGHAIGQYHICPITLSCLSRGFYWDGDTLHDISDPILAFVPPGLFGFVQPFRMNDNGDVAVRLAIPDIGTFSFHYRDGVATQIVPFDGAAMVNVTGMNELGQIVGTALMFDGVSTSSRGFVWNPINGTELVIEPARGFAHSGASDINDEGAIIGGYFTIDGSDGSAFVLDGETVTILNPLPGDVRAKPASINNDGLVAGISTDASFRDRGVVWAPDGSVHDMLDLVQYSDLLLSVWEMNPGQAVVGNYWPIHAAFQHFAYVWSPDGFVDLTSTLPDGSPVVLWEATGINESGQIAAWGDYPGFTSGGCFILTPRLDGVPADLNGDGVVNGLDLGILLANWSIPAGSPGCGGATPCAADLNGDGVVDGVDLGFLLANWTI